MNRLPSVILLAGFLLEGCGPVPPATSSRAFPSASATVSASAPQTSQPEPAGDSSISVGHSHDGGWFTLYFSDPADPASSQLTDGPDTALVSAIDSAQLSVDAALYSLSLVRVKRALIEAHRRGVTVRLVMESDNLDRAVPEALKDAGIAILGDRREGLMHNKFVVIDRREVWTGSMNLTADAAYSDRNNLIRIRSDKLAADYETEFNEMFVDDKFGENVVPATPFPSLTVDGTALEVYFSPDDHVQSALLDLLDHSTQSIQFLAYSFTSDPLSDAIRRRAAAGVTVTGVMDADQAASNIGTEYDTLRTAGIDVRLDGEPGLMHHKVMIIDSRIVVLGSYNFTASAERNNDENAIVLHDPAIAAQFLREFKRVFAAAGPG